jgi:hypothetical protein
VEEKERCKEYSLDHSSLFRCALSSLASPEGKKANFVLRTLLDRTEEQYLKKKK